MQVAQQRAVSVVRRVMAGESLMAALVVAVPGDSPGGGRRAALVQELAYGTLRHWGTLDATVRDLARGPFSDPALPVLIAVALYQLEHTRAPPFAVVDHAVAVAATLARPAAKGIVNAILRRFLRERDAVLGRIASDPVAKWSHPLWWIDRVRREYPERWEAVLEAGNQRPPLTLRANVRHGGREALLASFEAAGVETTLVGATGVIVNNPRALHELPGFAEGTFSVQDAGAQLAVPLLALSSGMRVLDACAAPGGKTTHIAELADVDLVALDRHAGRLARVADNFTRLALPKARLSLKVSDASEPSRWWDGRPFDRILADVPCTASGVVRRHPDVKWLRRESDIASFGRQQDRLLEALWPLLAQGGLLLYATCSLFKDENEARIAAFMERHADARREVPHLPSEVIREGGQLLPSRLTAGHNQDGFFYALLRKS